MRKAWPARFTGYLAERGVLLKDDAEVYAYGLQMGVEMLINIASTLLIGFLLGMVSESILFLASYMLVRSHAGGYHAESALACYVQSCAIIVGALLFCKRLPVDVAGPVALAFLLAAVPVILLFSPVAAVHKPLDSAETARYGEKSRIKTIFMVVVAFVLFVVGFHRHALILATGLFLIACLMIAGLIKNKLHPI